MILKGKKALIFGVANDRSLAFGIAKSFVAQGAKVALSYLNESMSKRVAPLAEEIGADFIFEMDVTQENHFGSMLDLVKQKWGTFDILVHSMAFADTQDLKNPFIQTSKAGFLQAMEVSAYSLVSLSNCLKDVLNSNGSVMTLTYHGSQKVMTNYNVMGVAKAALEASVRYLAYDLGANFVRVNAISAGPAKTLASSAVKGLRDFIKQVEDKAPLKRSINAQDVGQTAVYLASELSLNVTGQVLYVDSGISIMG